MNPDKAEALSWCLRHIMFMELKVKGQTVSGDWVASLIEKVVSGSFRASLLVIKIGDVVGVRFNQDSRVKS